MKEKQNTTSQTIRKCDVFISYRRDGGDMTAMYFYQALKNRGYNVFYDLEVLRAGKFNEALLDSIQSCTDFVLILSPHALDRCNDENDWVRREIAEALRTHKNIVPVMLKGFSFPEKLPGDIDDVRYQNGLTCTTEYFEESINRLCQRYLNSVPVSEGNGKRKSLVVPIAVVAVIVALAFAGFTFLRGGRQPQSEPTPTAIMEVTAEPTAVADITTEPAPVADITAEPVPVAQVTAEPAPEITAASVAEVTAPLDDEPSADAPEGVDVNGASAQAAPDVVRDTDFPVLSHLAEETNVPYNDEDEDAAHELRLDSPVLGNEALKRRDIVSITFLPTLEGAPADAWDVSEAGDGHVLAWATPNGDLYDLTVAGEGGVKILDPENESLLFSDYSSAVSIRFNGCVDLSERTNLDRLFWYCRNLRQLDLTGVYTGNATTMSGMFGFCEALEEVDLSLLDTGKVEGIGGMFLGCASLKRANLSALDTASLKVTEGLFAGCAALESVELEGFDTGLVVDMSYMFSGCGSLKALDVSGFDTSRVKRMDGMFLDCRNLEALEVSGFDTSRVANMEDMFSNCEALQALDVSGFDTSRGASMHDMFNNCRCLKTLDVSSFNTEKVTDMSGMFCDCHSLEALDLKGWNTGAVEDMRNMFWCCRVLDNIDPSAWNTGSVTNMENLFNECRMLYRLDLSNWDTRQVTNMRQLFANCDYAVELLVSNWDISAVEYMDGMFQGDGALESIGRDPATFGHGDTSDMYDGCGKLFES